MDTQAGIAYEKTKFIESIKVLNLVEGIDEKKVFENGSGGVEGFLALNGDDVKGIKETADGYHVQLQSGASFELDKNLKMVHAQGDSGLIENDMSNIDFAFLVTGIGDLAEFAVRKVGTAIAERAAVEAGSRVFWSGGGRAVAGEAAMEWAKVNASKTLEMTIRGRLMETFGKYLPRNMQGKIWESLCKFCKRR